MTMHFKVLCLGMPQQAICPSLQVSWTPGWQSALLAAASCKSQVMSSRLQTSWHTLTEKQYEYTLQEDLALLAATQKRNQQELQVCDPAESSHSRPVRRI